MENDKTIHEELELEQDEQEEEDYQPDDQPEESVEELKQRLAEEEARRIKAEEAIKKAKFVEKKKKETINDNFTNNTNNTPSDADSDARIRNLEIAESKRQFGYRNGLSPEAVDYLFKINPNPSAEDLKDPFIRGGLKEIERRNKVKLATPSSSVSSVVSTGNKSWASMTKEERAQAYNKRKLRS